MVKEKEIILSNRARAGIKSNRELAARIGMPKVTLDWRLSHPGTWIQHELRELARVTQMPDEDLLFLIKGK